MTRLRIRLLSAAALLIAAPSGVPADPAVPSPAVGTFAARLPSASAPAGANPVHPWDDRHPLASVWARGRRIGDEARTRTEARLERAIRRVDAAASRNQAVTAERLASAFGVAVASLVADREVLGASWSDLLIAHALAGSGNADVRDLFRLHDGGLGWSQVAHGLGLDLAQFLKAVAAECRVVAGRASPDGRAEPIGRNRSAATVERRARPAPSPAAAALARRAAGPVAGAGDGGR